MNIKDYLDNLNKIRTIKLENERFISQFNDRKRFIVHTYQRMSKTYKWFDCYDEIYFSADGTMFILDFKRWYGDDPEPDEHTIRLPIFLLTCDEEQVKDEIKIIVDKEDEEIKRRAEEQRIKEEEEQRKLEELHNSKEYKDYLELKKKFGE